MPAERLATELAVGERSHARFHFERLVTSRIVRTANSGANRRADASGKRLSNCGWIDNWGEDTSAISLPNRFAQDGVAVTRSARTSRIGGIHHHDGSRANCRRQTNGVFEAGQRHLHLLMVRPEAVGECNGMLLRGRFVAVRHRNTV